MAGHNGVKQLHSKETNRCIHSHQTLPPFFHAKGVACETTNGKG